MKQIIVKIPASLDELIRQYQDLARENLGGAPSKAKILEWLLAQPDAEKPIRKKIQSLSEVAGKLSSEKI